MAPRKVIVVDGANIAYAERTQDGKPKVSNLVQVRRALEEYGYEPVVLIDASLIYEIDDPDQLEALIDKQIVRQAPARTDADYFVLETAEREKAKIVSNDQFTQRREQYPWIEDRRVPVMIVNGDVELYEPNLEAD